MADQPTNTQAERMPTGKPESEGLANTRKTLALAR